MAQGNLGSQPFDLVHMMKSIVAFQAVATHKLYAEREKRKMPGRLVSEIAALHVFFEPVLFTIDPCTWIQTETSLKDLLVESPLAKKIKAIKTHHASMAENSTAEDPKTLDHEMQKRDGTASATASTSTATDTQTEHDPKENLTLNCGCDEKEDPRCVCDCDPKNAPCLPPDPCCAEIKYYTAQTLVLRDKVIGYTASDLAYIENVQAHETRERVHSFARTIVDFTETESTVTKSEERDHQITDRFSVQKEIKSQLTMDASMSASYGKEGAAYHLQLDAGISKVDSQREAREQFKETVDKAVSKVQSEARNLTSRRVTTEEKEVNTHSFKNKTPDHSVGKYFYVSKIVEGQVFGHGKRVQVELMIPTPAALYEHLEYKKMMKGFTKTPPKPIPKLPTNILVGDLDQYKLEYGIEAFPPVPVVPLPQVTIETYEAWPEDEETASGNASLVNVPAGYYGKQIRFLNDTDFDQERKDRSSQIAVTFGGGSIWRRWDEQRDYVASPGSQEVSGLINQQIASNPVVSYENMQHYKTAVQYDWEPLPVDLLPWKTQVWYLLKGAYKKQQEEFEGELQAYIAKYKENQMGRHPFADKEIMMAEIKRAAIYMMCENFERHGVMNMKSEPCGMPEINRPLAGEKTWDWYFWERAFDWGLMSFKFYDYFWNDMCTWPEKFNPGHPNYMFNQFLRAGFMRVQVPAGVGMDADVLWYIHKKEKWGSTGKTPDPDAGDLRWVHTIQEVKWSHDCYQNDREGMVHGYAPLGSTATTTRKLKIIGTNRYWNVSTGAQDAAAIADDVDRQIFIDAIAYRIQDIELAIELSDPTYSVSGDKLNWIVTLERDFEGEFPPNTNGDIREYNYAIGAEFIGAPFRWEEPTNLVWLGNTTREDGNGKLVPNLCLPDYPVKC